MSFQDSHSLNITVVGPDDAPTMALPIPIVYKETRSLDNFYPASPEQPDLAFATDNNSSGGYSTPITPFTHLLDLSAVDSHLGPTEGHEHHGLPTPLSPFSPSTLSPSFDGLSLSDGYSAHENSIFNSNDKSMHIPSLDFIAPSFQNEASFNATHPPLSLVIPPSSADSADFIKEIFQFDDIDSSLRPVEHTLSPAYQFPMAETLPAEPNLQRIPRNAAHNRGFSVAGTSWTGPNTGSTHLSSPSLCFTPSEYNSSALLSPPTPYGDGDVFLGSGAVTVQRRHSHTGGRSSSRAPERGRSDMRSHATSASSSRRSSPYPSPLIPSHSPDTLSPSQIWDTSNDHLTVPQDQGEHEPAALP
ncbi:hypothetical protein EST38_g8021 [Candolleomyces aberdarensis]|uniref:Uncharacterized protein n=1 Tax=Candolleomyces aberdarensis TaxID=2316362 RepID=A0A4Q2DH18_9AGAR|nr:hypothetical protein EST38_g8021 [Candolleomyces aberdarensis]